MEGPKPHKNWSNEIIKVLLDTCIEEMKTTGRNGVSLYRSSWVRLGQVQKDKFGMEFTQKEMKNGFDNLKAKYIGWLYLKNKTGNIYNPQTKMFTLTPEAWEDFKKIHKRAGSLQSNPLPYHELCEIVFQSISPNGDGQWTNSEGSGASASATSTSGASAIKERVGAIDINDDPLVDVNIDDEDDGNSRTQRLHDEARPKKKAKTSCGYAVCPETYCQNMNYVKKAKTSRVTLELLQGNDRQCIELLRMSRDSFVRLCTHFRVKEWLKDGKHVSVEEKMAMFLMMLGHNQRYVVIKNRFQHSTQTIHKFFHEVLDKVVEFAKEIIIPPNFNPNPNIPGHNRRLRQIFKGAVGALDGTLIHASVPKHKQHLYRGRGKGDCYQNVLAICDFNMMFTFFVAGWEGVAHDSRILSEAIRNPNAPFPLPPPDKYYLCDAAYAHTRGFMAPYRNVRYWLGDFRRRRALNSKEKFNHSHAKLRNLIERAYGVLKARFPILKKMVPFSLTTQRNITIACFALHNFIPKEGLDDEFFSRYEQSNVQLENDNVLVEVDDGVDEENQVVQPQGNASDRQYMTNLRNQIPQQLMQVIERVGS